MAQYSYQQLTLTENIVMSWPFAYPQLPLLLDINDVYPMANGYTITFPDATLTQPGQVVQITNISINTFMVLAKDGTTIIHTFIPGEMCILQLLDNSTSNGTWRIIPNIQESHIRAFNKLVFSQKMPLNGKI